MSVPLPAKALIVARGHRISDVAARVGVNAHSFGEILNGRRDAWPALRRRLAEELDAPVELLFPERSDDVVVQLVKRTTASSGVPERLDDAVAAEQIAAILRAGGGS